VLYVARALSAAWVEACGTCQESFSLLPLLQEGRPADILAYVDGALLVDLWDDLVLPRAVRSAWAPVIHASRGIAA
jgi:hypothetical protein